MEALNHELKLTQTNLKDLGRKNQGTKRMSPMRLTKNLKGKVNPKGNLIKLCTVPKLLQCPYK